MNTYAKQGEGGGGRRSDLSPRRFECSTPRIQPGGPVRGAGRRRSVGRRFGQARRCLPSSAPLCSMDALRPPMPVLPLSSDAHRATRRGFGWRPGSGDAYSELFAASAPRGAMLRSTPVTTGDAPIASGRRPPAHRPLSLLQKHYCLRSKRPSAARHWRRSSCRRWAPS